MSCELQMKTELSQQMNQFQIQSLNILMLDNYELEKFLQEEFIENPMLDYAGSSNGPILSGVSGGYRETTEYEAKSENEMDKQSFFFEQLCIDHYTLQQKKIMEFMVQCMNQSGYMDVSVEEISDLLGVPLEECKFCKKILQSLEPAGVFAENLKECLLLQLERKGLLNDKLIQMVEDHLEDMSTGNIASISRDVGIGTIEVQKYILMIQELNPRPFCDAQKEKTEYIVPDLILEQEQDQWTIKLNDSWFENYTFNDYYLKMMKEIQDAELKEYFRKKYERCNFILNSIRQRRETMLKIANEIVRWQEDYFFHQGKLKTMTMQEVADKIEMHVSTVSRAAKGKYIQYACGTVGLKSLFQSAHSFGEDGVGAKDIKMMLKKIIDKEDKKKPYSDQKIANQLIEKGMKISRRTVAKYREEMGIQGTYGRKKALQL